METTVLEQQQRKERNIHPGLMIILNIKSKH